MKDVFSFIRYANCWEDTNILRKGLRIQAKETGISIASGGDNTLALLLDNPAKIYAFDLNPTQLYLTELKIVCFQQLEYDEILKFMGVYEDAKRLETFQQLKRHLSKKARRFFEQNPHMIKRGVIHAGKFDHYFQLFRRYVAPLFISRRHFRQFANLSNLQEQVCFSDTYIENWRLKLLFKVYFGATMMGKLGRDKSFYKYVDEKSSSAHDIFQRYRFGIAHTYNATNPYLSYIATGNFKTDALPVYLQPENFTTIRDRIDRVELVLGDLNIFKDKKIDFANLSDIFEYMSREDFEKNIKLLQRILKKNGRIAYWNMQNRYYVADDSLMYDKKLSRRLFKQNQSWFYRDFLIYYKREK